MPFLPSHSSDAQCHPANALLPPEDSGLEALRSCGILDTPQDGSFDRLTRLATMLTGLPMALVSLVDSDRQWLKAQTDFGEGHGLQTLRNYLVLHACAG